MSKRLIILRISTIFKLPVLIADKDTLETANIEKQLLNTPKGAAFLDIRKDGIIDILTRNALRNPDTAAETKAFLDGWHGKANEYLKSLEKTE